MSHPSRKFILTLGLAGVLAAAQGEGLALQTEAKLRAGFGLTRPDQLRQGTLGLGLGVSAWTPVGRVGVEAGYFYKSGDAYLAPIDTPQAGMAKVDVLRSFDRRKNDLDGIQVRISLERPLEAGWHWQAGLMILGANYHHQVQADMQSEDWKPVTTQPAQGLWRDTYSSWKSERSLGFSPFVGLRVELHESSRLEFNALLLNYRTTQYVHTPGSGTYRTDLKDVTGKPVGPLADHNAFPGDHRTSTTRFVPHLEVGYAFQF